MANDRANSPALRPTGVALPFCTVPSVLIFTLAGCPFCVRAKALLDTKGCRYREVDVSSDWEQRASVSSRTGHRTFPQIFIGDRFIGGCDELHALDRAGRLDPLLA